MLVTSKPLPNNYPPFTVTPLQSKAINWIIGMRVAIAKLKARCTNENKAFELKARELQIGFQIVTRKGTRYLVISIDPYGDRLAVRGRGKSQSITFYFHPDQTVQVEEL